MSRVFLGLGSNVGNRFEYLLRAFEEIGKHYKIISISSIYETEAWGETQQQNFLNAVIEIEASESSRKIFSTIKSIEKNIGRIERGKWQAREIDIDILLNENEILETVVLTIPHKDLHNRKFVLVPMNQIAPNVIHPIFKKTIAQLLSECNDKSRIQISDFQLTRQ